MKLSTRARYALRMMLELARQSPGPTALSLAAIAEKSRISRRYLEQLAIDLKDASLVRGKSGRGGGYVLAIPPSAIKLGQIVEAAIGPINIVDCVLEPKICLKADFCECRSIYRLINQRITEVLNEFSLADLADERWLTNMRRQLDAH
jgi:Rrf2 family protein